MKSIESLNDQLMAMAAHRYCLGRRSYIVSSCLEWLRDTWDQFDLKNKQVMVRDTIEALMDDKAGYESHVDGWKEFTTWAWGRLNVDQQEWVKDAVAYKKKPWPI